nr:DUF3307 domain-containing protein [Allorhizocola rhizosphaerae]
MLSNPSALAAFGAIFGTLYAAHQVADHWVQTQHQADHKGLPGSQGRAACLAHVGSYTITSAVMIAVLAGVTGMTITFPWLVVGLWVSAVSHYVADRRVPLRRMADRLGKDPGWLERGGGLYALDQAWHYGWLWVSALVITVGAR